MSGSGTHFYILEGVLALNLFSFLFFRKMAQPFKLNLILFLSNEPFHFVFTLYFVKGVSVGILVSAKLTNSFSVEAGAWY